MLLKMPHTYVIEHEGIEEVFNWKYYHYWLVFIMLEGVIHDIRGETYLSISSSYESCCGYILQKKYITS